MLLFLFHAPSLRVESLPFGTSFYTCQFLGFLLDLDLGMQVLHLLAMGLGVFGLVVFFRFHPASRLLVTGFGLTLVVSGPA